MEKLLRKQASLTSTGLSSGFIDGSGKRPMKLSDEAVAAFAEVIGNDTQAIAKRKGIVEARQTYGCSALTSRLRDARIDDRKRLSVRKEQ